MTNGRFVRMSKNSSYLKYNRKK